MLKILALRVFNPPGKLVQPILTNLTWFRPKWLCYLAVGFYYILRARTSSKIYSESLKHTLSSLVSLEEKFCNCKYLKGKVANETSRESKENLKTSKHKKLISPPATPGIRDAHFTSWAQWKPILIFLLLFVEFSFYDFLMENCEHEECFIKYKGKRSCLTIFSSIVEARMNVNSFQDHENVIISLKFAKNDQWLA